MSNSVEDDSRNLDRRNALKCLGWAGTGAVFMVRAGIVSSVTLDQALAAPAEKRLPIGGAKPFSFVQISDSHIGFSKPANPDPLGTLRESLDKIRALPVRPDLVVHTGDITHLAQQDQFDLAKQIYGELGIPIHFVPGEHDLVDGSDPTAFLAAFGAGSKGNGWSSFDFNGVHFIALVNVVTLGDRGMGTLGREQVDWLKRDLSGLSSSTPIVLLTHFPLWPLYPDWGWGTEDGVSALALLKRFGSVTALNGHIHQVQTKVEGHIRFHSAMSTAYPQPAPGQGPGPGPLALPAEKLRKAIGISQLSYARTATPIATIDATLA